MKILSNIVIKSITNEEIIDVSYFIFQFLSKEHLFTFAFFLGGKNEKTYS
jgi:hypothetical protein